jgi:type III secretory pathway component EscV
LQKKLLSATAVMGVLIVMVPPRPTTAMDLMISQNIALLIGTLLVSQFILQRINLSVCPSLFLINVLFLSSPNGRTFIPHGVME